MFGGWRNLFVYTFSQICSQKIMFKIAGGGGVCLLRPHTQTARCPDHKPLLLFHLG